MNWNKQRSTQDIAKQEEIALMGKLPKHVAVIMDGNGRWAIEQGLPRIAGHKAGMDSVKDIVKACSQTGVKYLTLYAFSIENWKRPTAEVTGLMNLLEQYLRSEIDELHENNVKIHTIGKLSSLPKVVQKLLKESIERTSENIGLNLTLALSYSGRWDIVRAVQMIGLDIRRGKISPEDVTETVFASYLQTSNLPDADLMIRTSGEMRISNFLLWEVAYGEIYISNKYWPEFRRDDLYIALQNFMNRERRYGKISSQIVAENQEDKQATYLQKMMNVLKNK